MSEKIKIMVEGGKAKPTPQIAQQLGPMGINIGEMMNQINEKTSSFKGMKVPVTVEINKDKTYEISIGTPPASQLIKSELNLKKASGIPDKDFVGNLAIEDVIKIAKMKEQSLFINNLKSAINTILGTCCQMGVLVEGKITKDVIKEIKQGVYDSQIKAENSEVSQERRDKLKEELEEMKGKFTSEIEAIKAKQEKKEEEDKEKAPDEEKKEEPEKDKKK